MLTYLYLLCVLKKIPNPIDIQRFFRITITPPAARAIIRNVPKKPPKPNARIIVYSNTPPIIIRIPAAILTMLFSNMYLVGIYLSFNLILSLYSVKLH